MAHGWHRRPHRAVHLAQYGLIARWQALGVGISDWHLQARIDSGMLIPVHPGVYRLRGVPYTQDLRWLAAVLAGGGDARLSHLAAAAFHGFEVRRVRPSISVPHGRECNVVGIDVHRTRRLGDRLVIRKIPVTTPARTVLDLAAGMTSGFATFVENAVNGGRVSIESLLAILDVSAEGEASPPSANKTDDTTIAGDTRRTEPVRVPFAR